MGNAAVLTAGNHISVLVAGFQDAENMTIQLIQGQRAPLWALTFKTADNAALNLTGVTYTSGYLYDSQAVLGGVGLLLTGTFATVSASAGTATFAPSAADVASAGTYVFEVLLTISSLPYYFRCPVEILPRYGA